MSHSVTAGSLGGVDSNSASSHLCHGSSVDPSHVSRMQRDAVSPSYQSPMALPAVLPHKADSSLQKGPPAFLPAPPPSVVSIAAQQLRPDGKLEHSGHCSIDMVQLLKVGRRANFSFESMIIRLFFCCKSFRHIHLQKKRK